MRVIEPVSEQRKERILPGSKEREAIEVDSLDELKKTLDDANRIANEKRAKRNKRLVIGSILTIVFLLVSRGKSTWNVFKMKPNLISVLKKIGWVLSIGSLFRAAMSGGLNSGMTVIEPDGTISSSPNQNLIGTKSQSSEAELKKKSVKAAVDMLVENKIISESEVKNRSKALAYRKPKDIDPIILQELVEHGNKSK